MKIGLKIVELILTLTKTQYVVKFFHEDGPESILVVIQGIVDPFEHYQKVCVGATRLDLEKDIIGFLADTVIEINHLNGVI